MELGVGGFPEEKIAEALLVACADQQVNVARGGVADFAENFFEGFAVNARGFVETAGGAKNCFARGVVDRDSEMKFAAIGGGGFGFFHRGNKFRDQAIAAADDGYADSSVEIIGNTYAKKFREDAHSRANFVWRLQEIVSGARVQSERIDSHRGCGARDREDIRGSGGDACGSGLAAASGPTSAA